MSPRPVEYHDQLTKHARAWHAEGEPETVLGHTIHVRRRVGGAPMLLLIHGFPTSSFDWRLVLQQERDHAAIAFDLLGFGCSDKPPGHPYSVAEQAEIAAELVRVHSEGRPVLVVGHDIGAAVAAELIARRLEGDIAIEIAGAVLLGAGALIDPAAVSASRKLVHGPLGARFAGRRHFRHELARLFSRSHSPAKEDAADQWSLIEHNDGHRVADAILDRYLSEAESAGDRWRGALAAWPQPLRAVWGADDPIAPPDAVARLRALRGDIEVTTIDDAGHYPHIEVPHRVVAVLREAFAARPDRGGEPSAASA